LQPQAYSHHGGYCISAKPLHMPSGSLKIKYISINTSLWWEGLNLIIQCVHVNWPVIKSDLLLLPIPANPTRTVVLTWMNNEFDLDGITILQTNRLTHHLNCSISEFSFCYDNRKSTSSIQINNLLVETRYKTYPRVCFIHFSSSLFCKSKATYFYCKKTGSKRETINLREN
jgi:hypothetical protein